LGNNSAHIIYIIENPDIKDALATFLPDTGMKQILSEFGHFFILNVVVVNNLGGQFWGSILGVNFGGQFWGSILGA
jgi:hypothetical protein